MGIYYLYVFSFKITACFMSCDGITYMMCHMFIVLAPLSRLLLALLFQSVFLWICQHFVYTIFSCMFLFPDIDIPVYPNLVLNVFTFEPSKNISDRYTVYLYKCLPVSAFVNKRN